MGPTRLGLRTRSARPAWLAHATRRPPALPALDRKARLEDTEVVFPDPRLGPVLSLERGDNVDVIRAYRTGDSGHRLVVTGPGPGRFCAWSLPRPIPTEHRENRIAQSGPRHADAIPAVPRSSASIGWIQLRRMLPTGNQVWINLLLPPTPGPRRAPSPPPSPLVHR
jgi:hypothetical protein